MADNFKEFNRLVMREADRLTRDEFVLFHKKIVIEAFSRIVLKTPVDTGRARGGWQVSVGSLPGGGESNTFDTAGDGTITLGIGQLGGLPPYEVVYISNSVPYIEILENGRVEDANGILRGSEQAPNGMVAVTVAELTSIFGN